MPRSPRSNDERTETSVSASDVSECDDHRSNSEGVVLRHCDDRRGTRTLPTNGLPWPALLGTSGGGSLWRNRGTCKVTLPRSKSSCLPRAALSGRLNWRYCTRQLQRRGTRRVDRGAQQDRRHGRAALASDRFADLRPGIRTPIDGRGTRKQRKDHQTFGAAISNDFAADWRASSWSRRRGYSDAELRLAGPRKAVPASAASADARFRADLLDVKAE